MQHLLFSGCYGDVFLSRWTEQQGGQSVFSTATPAPEGCSAQEGGVERTQNWEWGRAGVGKDRGLAPDLPFACELQVQEPS